MVQIVKYLPQKSHFIDVNGWYTTRSNEPRGASSHRARGARDAPNLPESIADTAAQVTASCHRFSGRPAPDDGAPAEVTDLSVALDLRRAQPPEVGASLLALARHLPRSERRLIEAVYADGRTLAEIAEAAGLPPRTLRRAYRRIVLRLIQPRFAFVAAGAHAWPDRRRLVATLHILRARTLRDTARRLGLTEHAVRRELAVVDALFNEFIAGR